MQYKHATFLLFIIFIGTGILTVAVFQRRAALEEAEEVSAIAIEQAHEDEEDLPALFGNQYRALSTDLDGDGVVESITLTIEQTEGMGTSRTLQVNQSSADVNETGAGLATGNPQLYFGIVDLNTTDGVKEIALSDEGPSSDPTTEFYRFDGSKLVKIGSTQGLYESMTFDGKGTLTTMTRATMLDTWFFTDQFTLDSTGMLVHVDKAFYDRLGDMNSLTLTAPKAFYTAPVGILGDPQTAFASTVGDVVTLVGCDNIEWCKVKNTVGVEGWFLVTGLDLGIFEGLSFAD